MRALVTGAGGFVGRHLVRHLTEAGDEVVTTDPAHGGADITDPAAIAAEVAAAGPEVVYHLAGWADVGGSWAHPVEAFRANAEGTLNVLSACQAAGVQRVVAVSSADVYGKVRPEELPLTEDSPLRPASPYAASKVAADYLGLQAWLGHGLPVMRVRAFNHLGPGQADKFLASALASRIAGAERDGRQVLSIGDLSPRRDFTDVRDVVRAYRLLAERGEPGEAYNVCSGTDLAVQQVADVLLGLSEATLRLETDPDLLRPVEIPVLRGSHAKLTAATGWEPEIAIEDTLAELLADWRTRLTA
ncbi:MAG TPA: GDP-mannose 4,6-dehydratase [Acidimicrobiales bacterium]|nr:GDP-mannose 4,6-dehydratase [Acidimicrobiales bacterium]